MILRLIGNLLTIFSLALGVSYNIFRLRECWASHGLVLFAVSLIVFVFFSTKITHPKNSTDDVVESPIKKDSIYHMLGIFGIHTTLILSKFLEFLGCLIIRIVLIFEILIYMYIFTYIYTYTLQLVIWLCNIQLIKSMNLY